MKKTLFIFMCLLPRFLLADSTEVFRTTTDDASVATTRYHLKMAIECVAARDYLCVRDLMDQGHLVGIPNTQVQIMQHDRMSTSRGKIPVIEVRVKGTTVVGWMPLAHLKPKKRK